MNVVVAITLGAVVFGLGVVAGFEFAREWYAQEIAERVRELQWLRGQMSDREHPA